MEELAFTKLTAPPDPSFTCGVESINRMIQDSYFLCLLKRCYTYQVTARGTVIAYYRIELRRFDNSKFDPPLEEYSLGLYQDLYALHIQYIAVQKNFQKHHIGNAVLEHILRSIDQIVSCCPPRLVTLEAFGELVSWYQQHGFKSLGISRENPETEFMFMDLLSDEDCGKLQAMAEG